MLDMMAFLFEIRQAAVLNEEQRSRLAGFFSKQKAVLVEFCGERGISGAEEFLQAMKFFEPPLP